MSEGELRPLEVASRLGRLREGFESAGIDAIVITNLTNVRYLTGFTGSAALLVVAREGAVLTTDGRYRTQSAEQLEAAGVAATVDIAIGGGEEQRAAALAQLAGSTLVGLEAEHVTWAQATSWEERLERALVQCTGLVESLRERKDDGEIDRMRRAASIADQALGNVLALIGSGITETAFALALDAEMRRLGAESVAFETIVASGPNSAKPHHHPSDRPIGKGDPVVVDFGATFEGYRSDMTRTFCVGGEPQGALKEIFDLVAASQAAGAAGVRPGAAASEIDELCRSIITEGGFGDRFEHSTGHGVGLDIHELPWVSSLGTAILEPGAVVTVEPGVYVPGVGGVRIEDTLVVTEDGAEPLTRFTKEVAA